MTSTILVADDDFNNRTIIQDVLEGAGYKVILATNGEDALDLTVRERPDVLLLDLAMPKLNGWEVATRIRRNADLASVAIVAFTAHALVGDEVKAKEAGCDDYLRKPCMPQEIAQKVASWIKVRIPHK